MLARRPAEVRVRSCSGTTVLVIIAGMNDPRLRDLSAAPDLLKPFDAGLEAALSVSARINRVENHDEGCVRAPLLQGEVEKPLM